MSAITFENEFGNEISSTQAELLSTYTQVVIDDNNQKSKNTFINGVHVGTMYTVTSYDLMSPILQQNANASFELMTTLNNYTISEMQSYKDGVINYKNKTVLDSMDNPICFQVFDIETDTPKHIYTQKSYFDESGERIYEFVYNNDGSCFSIERPQITSADSEFVISKIGTDPEITFTWEGFEYYKNSNPLIPAN